jgi:hypothetical protein
MQAVGRHNNDPGNSVTASVFARPGLLARIALALLAFVGLASCGGAVGPSVSDPTRITILPATATLYSGLPTTFTISGGTGAYIVSSSNQAIIPVSGAISGSQVIVAPNPVLADTPVTLTVRDTGSTPLATAALTVRPNTVSNSITVTPSGTQGGNCAPAVCSGGDAELTATISQGGIPLAARGVRLEVISGDFRFIVTPPGTTGELLATSVDVVTDEQGGVHARIRALADAPNQTALVQVTDLGTGAFQRASFLIAQATGTSPGFFVTPSSITFTGVFTGQCANNLSAVVYVIGGLPPYNVLNSGGDAFTISNNIVSNSGESFFVTSTGICTGTGGIPIVVRDSAGHTATVTVSNVPGTTAASDVVATPDTVSLASCSASASVSVSGGTGTYIVSSGNSSLVTSISGNTLTIRRRVPSAAPGSTSVQVSVSDGRTSDTITVTGPGLTNPCDSSTLAVSPSTVTLASCTAVFVNATGGTGPASYSVVSDNSSVTATVNIGTGQIQINRTSPSGGFVPPATVTLSDNTATRFITVNATGTGVNSGTGPCP